jgi:ATP-dependent helicase/nuclease subunit B
MSFYAHKLLSVRTAFRENTPVHVRFLPGPAGSGKTWRCLAEIRAALAADPAGAPLILLAPKQATFQLERQLLADESLSGFARLQILSFERLATFVLEHASVPPPSYLSEEGRVMVLRALLMRHEGGLRLFKRSARRVGFARQLSRLLEELQQHQVGHAKLRAWAGQTDLPRELRDKLLDLATLLEAYRQWSDEHRLQDGNHLLDLAAELLGPNRRPPLKLNISHLWLDGFAEMTPQELDLLMAVLPHCHGATLAFCLDAAAGVSRHRGGDSLSPPNTVAGIPESNVCSRAAPGTADTGTPRLGDVETRPAGSWLSIWSAIARLYEQCRQRATLLPNTTITIEPLAAAHDRFANSPTLQWLEQGWSRHTATDAIEPFPIQGIRIAVCAQPEAEAILAARAILETVRAGRRFRDCAVLVRNLDGYHKAIARSFRRYGIPFFLDRRESIAHHPLAELTRSALRTVALDWQHEDWFSTLKAGFSTVAETQIDRLENESLARGWRGQKWREPIQINDNPSMQTWAERLRLEILPPFDRLAKQLTVNKSRPDGPRLAAALRQLWRSLKVDDILEHWATAAVSEAAIHRTVREQMNAWLDSVELAFKGESLPLRDWLPILDAGLATLTVGVIPPALDQVLIGAIDRARNPELRLTVVLGLNEGVFPASPPPPPILSEDDRAELNERALFLSPDQRERLARERFYGYIACTRSREQLLLVYARHNTAGQALNPSPFIGEMQRLFPSLPTETFDSEIPWQESVTAGELAPVIFSAAASGWGQLVPTPSPSPESVDDPLVTHDPSLNTTSTPSQPWHELLALPVLVEWVRRLAALREPDPAESLSPALAQKLYGPVLRSSVSRLEEFAACPFRFFVKSGLQAGERKLFELDARERGNFQHDVLKVFHERLEAENRRWRDLAPAEARARIGAIGEEVMANYRDGLFRESPKTLFAARAMTGALQDFVEVIVTWLRDQYDFDPTLAEIAFDHKPGSRIPAWELPLGPELPGLKLSLHGRIDRVDVWRDPDGKSALAVIIDYKSSGKKLDPLLVEHGVQLQLLAYLNVLRHWKNPSLWPGLERLDPAGVFYVNLRGSFTSGGTRDEVLSDATQTRQQAWRHTGKFDASRLSQLDRAKNSDQFNYRVNQDGTLRKGSTEALLPEEFLALLDRVESQLIAMGRQIFAGTAAVDPYRKGSTTPCDFCDYQSICRIDPWTHKYRRLRPAEETTP